LKANHNEKELADTSAQLFTTSKIENFESKSQHVSYNIIRKICCSRHQRSKILKANHNCLLQSSLFCKLFTTSKIENFVSKSQPLHIAGVLDFGCSRHQRSKILKANHNLGYSLHFHTVVVHDIKDRKFWKQITTEKPSLFSFFKLFTTSKIENFESKSQPEVELEKFMSSCSRHQRSKILKANHNLSLIWLLWFSVVHDIKDRKFWKQITTTEKEVKKLQKLFTTSKIENFESKSELAISNWQLAIELFEVAKIEQFWQVRTPYTHYEPITFYSLWLEGFGIIIQ